MRGDTRQILTASPVPFFEGKAPLDVAAGNEFSAVRIACLSRNAVYHDGLRAYNSPGLALQTWRPALCGLDLPFFLPSPGDHLGRCRVHYGPEPRGSLWSRARPEPQGLGQDVHQGGARGPASWGHGGAPSGRYGPRVCVCVCAGHWAHAPSLSSTHTLPLPALADVRLASAPCTLA